MENQELRRRKSARMRLFGAAVAMVSALVCNLVPSEGHAQFYRWNSAVTPYVKNSSVCEVHRNAYNTYVSFYNDATTQAERQQWLRMIEEERRQMRADGC